MSTSLDKATIKLGKNLENGLAYLENGLAYITIEEGAFVYYWNDKEKYKGFSDAQTWNFTAGTPDNTAPTIATLSPGDNATGVAPNTNLVITFSEDIYKGTGKITLNGAKQEIDVTSDAVTIAGKTATINPPTDFEFLDAGQRTDTFGCFQRRLWNRLCRNQ